MRMHTYICVCIKHHRVEAEKIKVRSNYISIIIGDLLDWKPHTETVLRIHGGRWISPESGERTRAV